MEIGRQIYDKERDYNDACYTNTWTVPDVFVNLDIKIIELSVGGSALIKIVHATSHTHAQLV